MALSVGRSCGRASRVCPRLAPGLRGVAPCGARTFLPPDLRPESDSPPFQVRELFTKRMSFDDLKDFLNKDVEKFRAKARKYYRY